jgi:hypothetical protein
LALRLGQAKGEDVADLIARKQYAKAIDIIKEQLKTQKNDARVRLQLGDVLVMANRPAEAVAVLIPLADEYARDGFAAKAVAVYKRIQKIDPRRRDVESRLAALIEEKQKQATVPLASAPVRVEFGFEEIQPGMELGIEPIDDMGMELEVAAPSLAIAADAVPEPEPLPEIEPEPAPPPPARSAAPAPAPVEDHDLAFSEGEELQLEPEPELHVEPDLVLEAEPPEAPIGGPTIPMPVIEADLPVIEAEPAAGSADPLGDDLFAQELMSVLEEAFPGADVQPPAAAGPTDDCGVGGSRQIIVSPLFRDFSVDELVAVIQGLKLICYEAGEIIIGEGEPGDSLYMLSAGRVKAFKRNPAGKQALLGEMSEGAFFGEISVLTGKPRSATVVAATACELLELDRRTLDQITATHPHVWDVLREYAERRTKGQP